MAAIAVCYLARGADLDWQRSLSRFVHSYERCPAGTSHSLYVIFKGFGSDSDLHHAKSLFSPVNYQPIFVSDDRFDIGAYADAAVQIPEEDICFFNSNSELLAEDWLTKFSINFAESGVGLVGATGSFESLKEFNGLFPPFPNAHVRSNAFMIEREVFCLLVNDFRFGEKLDTFLFESGPRSMTRRILDQGLRVLTVGRNGRGYPVRWWPRSDTFRQGAQRNLLVADNQTRNFEASRWPEKRAAVLRTWGDYLQDAKAHL